MQLWIMNVELMKTDIAEAAVQEQQLIQKHYLRETK